MAGRGRCVRHDGWPKRFLRRGRRGGMARRVADRTLRSDVTGGRPRAVVLAIVRRGSCDCALRLMLEEGTKRTNGKRAPARTGGGACFGTGARPDGHMPRFMRSRAACHEPRFMRSCAVVHAPARRLTCGRAAAPTIVRRLPLRLRAAAHAGGRNETDKRETRPRPYGRGRVFWDGGAAAGLFLRRGWGGASGRVLPNFCAVGRIVRGNVTGGAMGARRGGQQEYFAAGTGAVWLPYGALWRPAVACGMARPCG